MYLKFNIAHPNRAKLFSICNKLNAQKLRLHKTTWAVLTTSTTDNMQSKWIYQQNKIKDIIIVLLHNTNPGKKTLGEINVFSSTAIFITSV